jgi:Family of unknown function (DUF6069)
MTAHNRRRIATVAFAPIAALAAWAVVRMAGIDLALRDGGTVGPGEVVTAALIGALGGWLVARWLERRSVRPRRTWSFVGSTALAVSIMGPAWRADGSSAVALIALHVATAVVVIAGFAGTVPVRPPAAIRRPAVAERASV